MLIHFGDCLRSYQTGVPQRAQKARVLPVSGSSKRVTLRAPLTMRKRFRHVPTYVA